MPFSETGSGNIAVIKQNVCVIGGGNICNITQSVSLRITGVGQLATITQRVSQVGSGPLMRFEQKTINSAASQSSLQSQGISFYQRNGWTVDIVVGGTSIPVSQIQSVTITRTAGTAAEASFVLVKSTGVQNPEAFQGKPVKIFCKTPSTGRVRIFTGWVDTPSLDIIEKKITYKCTDRRKNQILKLSQAYVKGIGTFSEDVFGTPTDRSVELDFRMQTVAADFDFDASGNPTYTTWNPKTTPDFTFTDSDVYYSKPQINYTNKSHTVNTIDISLVYEYERLHNQVCTMIWFGYVDFCRDWANNGYPSFPSKQMILQAAEGGGWKVVDGIHFTELWPEGWYTCSTAGYILWHPDQEEFQYTPETKSAKLKNGGSTTFSDGNQYSINTQVYDPDGFAKYAPRGGNVSYSGGALCRSATWTAALKFSQTVSETYNITLKSPQAITRYGVITETDSANITDDYNESSWSDDPTREGYTTNLYINKDTNRVRVQVAINCIIQKGITTLKAAHRDAEVSFSTDIKPTLDLKHTVRINSNPIDAKGKVKSITHEFSALEPSAKTTVIIGLSRATGSDSNGTFAVPSPISEPDGSTYIDTNFVVGLQNYLGRDPADGADWNGYVGNKNITLPDRPIYRTNYAEMFISTYPSIPNRIRKKRLLSSSHTFNVHIPNDSLTVTF